LHIASDAVNFIRSGFTLLPTSVKAQISPLNLLSLKTIKELQGLHMAGSYHLHSMKHLEN
jgi:hypothetical protein